MPSIWNKYTKLKKINSNLNMKTYLARKEFIVKEISPKDKDNYDMIYEYFNNLKNELNIHDIIEEDEKIYIVMDNNEETKDKFDKIIMSEEFGIRKESVLEGHGNPINKDEIFNLLKMEKSMCRINFERVETNQIRKGKGTGFFCKIEKPEFPIKYCLFTNNHVLIEENLQLDSKISFEYYTGEKYIEKEIKIDKKRKVFTSKDLDYSCVELFESDDILHFFKIDPFLYKNDCNISYLKDNDIFILQYPNGNDLCISHGKILLLNDNIIKHSASTNSGSSGSPIIRRGKENYVIGLHFGGHRKKEFNFATNLNSILEHMKGNEINCVYIAKDDEKEIKLIHDYNYNINNWSQNYKNMYSEAKKTNEKLFKENIELYVNDIKTGFDFKYKIKDLKKIKVKFKFKTKLTSTSYMFYNCSSLSSIDLSAFNTSNVNNMSWMFSCCSNLKYLNLSSFNTSNVENMSSMFNGCFSLQSIDLSSFTTDNVTDMSHMFKYCKSLKSIDLSKFNTSKVNNFDLDDIFTGCSSLKKENIITNSSSEMCVIQ